MTKHTSRDAIWHAALEVAREHASESSRWKRRFGIGEVAEQADADVSRRTVRDTLATMADLGELAEGRRQGEYEPTERMQTCADAVGPVEEERARSAADSGPSSAPSEPEGSDVGWTPNATTADSEPAAAADVAAAVEGEPVEDADDLEADVEEQAGALDLPGDGDLLERRRTAVLACYRYLAREGSASKSEFIDDVYPDHNAGYGSAGGWWNAVGKQGLAGLADRRADVEAPSEGAHTWRYVEGN